MQSNKAKKIITDIHAWIGVISSLFMLAAAITGMVITFSAALLNFETGGFPSVEKRSLDNPIDVGELQAKAQSHAGEKFIPLGYLGADAEIATHVEMIYGMSDLPEQGGEIQIITFDPKTDEVIDTFYLDRTFTHELIEFHYNLLLGDVGALWVAAIGLLMAALSLVGLYLWWPLKKLTFKKMRTLRLSKNLKQTSFSLHSFFGFWSALLILTWGLTGVYWSKPEWGPDFIKPATSSLPDNQLQRIQQTVCDDFVSINEAIAIAISSFPNTWIKEVEFAAPWQPFHTIYLSTSNDVDRKDGDSRVWVSVQCIGLVYTETVSGLEHIGAINSSIHSGETFGTLRIPIILLIGLLTSLISITGIILWFKRLSK